MKNRRFFLRSLRLLPLLGALLALAPPSAAIGASDVPIGKVAITASGGFAAVASTVPVHISVSSGTLKLFETGAYGSSSQGQSYTADATNDPQFAQFIAVLTNGANDSIFTQASGSGAGGQESTRITDRHAAATGSDLAGFTITRAVLTFQTISVVSPGRNLSGNGIWTDFTVSATVTFYGVANLPPTVTAISPTSGSVAGGTSVTISGTNFTNVTSVTIGGVAATNVSVVNATSVTATTGAHAAGLADVSLAGDGGTGTATGIYSYSNTAPIAPNGNTTGTTGDSKTVTVASLVTPTDADSHTVTVTGVTAVAGLTVSNTATAFTFTPSAAFIGNGSFTYTVSDGNGGTATGTITVAITDNDAPTLAAPVSGFIPLTLTAVAGPSGTAALPDYGTQAVASDNAAVVSVTQTPAAGTTQAVGPVAVSLVARDAADNVSTALTFTVTVVANALPKLTVTGAPLVAQTLVNFTGSTGGSLGQTADGPFAIGSDGNFYGVTGGGGAGNFGTIFKMTPAGVFTTLVEFTGTVGSAKGTRPIGSLTLGVDGNFYGMTQQGGAGDFGTMFKVSPTGVFTTLREFNGDSGANPGKYPYTGMVRDSAGNMYGTVGEGGGSGYIGYAFKLSVEGAFSILAGFTSSGPVGYYGMSGLVLASDNNLYGASYYGGEFGHGSIYRLSLTGTLTRLVSFTGNTGAAKGQYLKGRLIQGSDGALYGAAQGGGASGFGTIYKMTLGGVFTTLAEFTGTSGGTPGQSITHALTEGNAGEYYGTTFNGLSGTTGTVFKVNSAGILTTVLNFPSGGPTTSPYNSITKGLDGTLYGGTSSGGSGSKGVIFKIANGTAVVTAVEGSAATQSGTFSDADGNAGVTVTASAGTITQDNATGTWSWSAPATEGPATSSVAITATDSVGAITTAAFTFAQTNGAPSVAISAPVTANRNTSVNYTFNATDPSSVDQAAGFFWTLNYGDGTGNATVPAGTASPLSRTHTFASAGVYTVTATARDKNSATSVAASQQITISGPPVISAASIASLSGTSVTLGGDVTSDGLAEITERGVVYSLTATNNNPLIGGAGVSKVMGTGTTGVFTVGATSLAPGVAYSFKAYATNSVGTTYTSPVSSFTTLTIPEITVQQPVSTDFAENSAQSFGSVNIGATSSLTFTVVNSGNGNLTGLALSKAGGDAGDFTLSTLASTTLVPSATMTFTITFSPQSVGTRTAVIQITSNDADENPFRIQVSGTGASPEIVVEQPLGTDVADGGGRTFGSVEVGGNASLTFTLLNTGTADLTGLTMTKDGVAAADFTVTATPVAPVAGSGGSTTLTVRFAPTLAGTRNAVLHIASNDSDENPFDIALSGTGLIRGALAIGAPLIVALEEGGTVQIPVTRAGGSDGAVSVQVSTTNATASAPGDYTALTNYIVNFADGDATTKMVPITIKADTLATEISEAFTVKLTSPTGGAALGAVSTATVKIAEPESVIPTVSITAPAVNAKIVGGVVDIKGQANDGKGLLKVEVSLNGGAYVEAALTLANPATSLFGTWVLPVTPLAGTNTVTVRSVDLRGSMSNLVSRTFSYVDTEAPLLTITPAAGGTVTWTPALVGGKAQIGATYTLKATAKAGYFWHEWTAPGVTGAAAEATSLTFVMTAGMAITANFVTNDFRVGTYTGLAQATGATTPGQNNLGLFSGTLATTGKLTGKVTFGGTATSFVATFDKITGDAAGDNSTATAAATLSYDLNLDLAEGGEKITGTVTQIASGDVSAVDADRAGFSATSKLPAAYLKPGDSTKNGTYTVVFPSLPEQNGLTSDEYPSGDGFGTVTLTPVGLATLVGTMADGTAVTGSAPLSKLYEWPLAAFVKSTATVTGMTLGGVVKFDSAQAASDLSATDVQWFRPARAAAAQYPAGWPNGISVNAVGAHYNNALTVQASLGLGSASPTNGQLVFADGGLTAEVVKTSFGITGSVVTKVIDPVKVDASYTLSVVQSSGAFSGTFTPNWATPIVTKPSFKGVILQKGESQGGYGFFLNNGSGAANKQGGGVTLGRE